MMKQRMQRRNKQTMKYSLQGSTYPIYKKDDDGNIIYKDIDGNLEPVETGEYITGYEPTVDFCASINGRLHEAMVRAFGTDESNNYAQIVAEKNTLPFKIGTRIWKKSEVIYKDSEKTIVDGDSADYVVRGILDESLNEDMFYLQKLNHEQGV